MPSNYNLGEQQETGENMGRLDSIRLADGQTEVNTGYPTGVPKMAILSRIRQSPTCFLGAIIAVVAVVALFFIADFFDFLDGRDRHHDKHGHIHSSDSEDEKGQPIKSANDPISYRVITLDNGLKVLLASDPDTETSSAAMNVAVGSNADPKDREGLAHFCEHMLFMGSEKYPEEDGMSQFASRNGGYVNAFTSDSVTNYRFTCQNDAIREGLDRFAQFFISPILMEESVEREVKAVNNEHEKNLQSDAWRTWQLMKELANNESSWHRFSTGKMATLNKPDTLQKLKDFYETYYRSASQMQLAVISKASLDELQRMVQESFAGLSTHPSPPTFFTPDVPLFKNTGIKVHMNPVKDIKAISFVWALPDLSSQYRLQVDSFIKYILVGTSAGSLGSYLKEQGWITSISSTPEVMHGIATLLSMDMVLTTTGLENHQDDIIETVFRYIQLTEDLTCKEWVSMLELQELAFRFQKKTDPDSFTTAVTQNLQTMDPEDVLGSPENFHCDLPFAKTVFKLLTPENVIVIVTARGEANAFDKREPIYGTQYNLTEFPALSKERWASLHPWPTMTLPPQNHFIPKNFELVRHEHGPVSLIPDSIAEGPHVPHAWLSHSKIAAKKPVFAFACHVQAPKQIEANATTSVALELFTNLLSDSLDEVSNMALQAGLVFGVVVNPDTVQLYLSGYTDTLGELLDEVLKPLKSTSTLGKRFANIKSELATELGNLPYENLYLYVFRELRPMVVHAVSTTPMARLEALRNLSFDDVKRVADAHLARQMHVDCLGHGNVKGEDVQDMTDDVAEVFLRPDLMSQNLTSSNLHRFNVGKTIIQMDNPNSNDGNSAYLSSYQMEHTGDDSRKDALTIELIGQLIGNLAFAELRTEQQLGYIVLARAALSESPFYTVSHFHILIQSSDFEADLLDERASEFLDAQEGYLQHNVSDADFTTAQKGLFLKLWPAPASIDKEFEPILTEVEKGMYRWRRRQKDRMMIEEITLADCLRLYRKMFVDPLTTRKVSLLVYLHNSPKKIPTGVAEPTTIYPSIESWAKTVDIIQGN